MKYEPRPYQEAYYNSDWAFARGFYLAYDPRMGKTHTETMAIVRRMFARGVTRTLVVGPKNPLLMTWLDELQNAGFAPFAPAFTPNNAIVVPLADGPLIERAKIVEQFVTYKHATVMLVNFEALDDYYEPIEKQGRFFVFRTKSYPSLRQARAARERSTSKTLGDLLQEWKPKCVVIDEAHLLSSAGSKRSRILRRLCRDAQYVRLLSGTPDPKRARSFYAQYVCLDPNIFGTSQERFIDKYFIRNPYQQGRVDGLRPEMMNEFYQKVYSVMSVVRTDDYFKDAEKPNVVTRNLAWPDKARKVYDTLYKDCVLSGYVPGSSEDEENSLVVDGTHKLTKSLRLRQLCGGFLQDEMTAKIQWIHRTKEEAIVADLSEILADDSQFVVISYAFTACGEHLVQTIGRAYGSERVVLCNGKTRDAEDVLRAFDFNNQSKTRFRVLVLQETVGSVGISLARARHLFFHSWSMDSAAHAQMTRRVWDPSRASNITYYQMERSADITAREIVEAKLRESVMAR